MADPLLRVDIDTSALLTLLSKVGPEVEVYTKRAAHVTANRIALEARNRVARATGQTMEGIQVEDLRTGSGYAVTASRQWMPNLPLWLERGVQQGKPRSHTQAARPFLEPAAKLEEGPHRDRVTAAVIEAIRAAGGEVT